MSDASDTLCFNTFVYQFQLSYKYQEHDKCEFSYTFEVSKNIPGLYVAPGLKMLV